jgi:hypothetical protein
MRIAVNVWVYKSTTAVTAVVLCVIPETDTTLHTNPIYLTAYLPPFFVQKIPGCHRNAR